MKTVIQIKQKMNALKATLKRKPVCENFGDTEQRELANYIGYIYDYDYERRQEIEDISDSFFQWRINYTGI